VGAFKNTSVIQLEFKIKRLFTGPFFVAVQPFATARGPLKECSSPWTDMYMCDLLRQRTPWAFFCQLWLDKQ